MIFCILTVLVTGCGQAATVSTNTDSVVVQTSIFIWADDICEYESVFDSTKTTRIELQNAHLLMMDWGDFNIRNTPTIWNNSVDRREALKNEYVDKKTNLLDLDLPKNQIWETLRQEKLQEIEQFYKFSDVFYDVFLFDNMEAFGELEENESCLYYSTALTLGGDSLLSAWRHLTEIQASRNARPENIWSTYQRQMNSENKFQYAKEQLLVFGWWNCAVEHMDGFNQRKAREEFEKLFTMTKIKECEER